MPYIASCTVCGSKINAEEESELAAKLKEHYNAENLAGGSGRCNLFYVEGSVMNASGVIKRLPPVTLEVFCGVLVKNEITGNVWPSAVRLGKERK